MADHEAVGRAREAAVGDERAPRAEAAADERRAGTEHLGHARRALGPLVADHDDDARDDGRVPGHDRRVRVLL